MVGFGALYLLIAFMGCEGLPLMEDSLGPSSADYTDYQLGVRYDEYPLIVPKKRTALLVNHLMVALKEALENEQRTNLRSVDNFSGPKSNKMYPVSSEDVRTMDLERRGRGNLGQKGRNYWRCYFNAVTCF